MNITEFAALHRLKVQRDADDGTLVVRGREGRSHIYEYSDELLAVMVMPLTGTAHRWKAARAAFESVRMVIRQAGDEEGAATFDPTNSEQVRAALKYAKVRPKRQVSEAQRQRLRDLGMLRQKASTIAVQSDLTT